MRKIRQAMLQRFRISDEGWGTRVSPAWAQRASLPQYSWTRLPAQDPDGTLLMLEWARLRLGPYIGPGGELLPALRHRFRAVLGGQAWEAAFPLPWTLPVRPRCTTRALATEASTCPDIVCHERFRNPELLVSPLGRLLTPPSHCVARARVLLRIHR